MTPKRLREVKQIMAFNIVGLELITALEEAWAEVERLQAWVNDLHSGMYINCVYCGHRYGPDPGTPVAMAEVLRQHIEKCPKHPLSAMKKRAEQAEAERDKQRRHRKWLVQELHGLQDAYNTLEDDRDKWMGQFDEAEHRGLAYMEERDKLAAQVKLLESDLKNSHACWNAACEDITKYKARVKKLETEVLNYRGGATP